MPAALRHRDRAHLARAIAVAEGARRRSSPNPPVGCVLVRGDEVVAESATQAVGGPHAEARALACAGSAAEGATAYVTLEPCAHHGRTPPCAGALRDAGVRRVVYGLDDPHEQASGGAAVLREAGIEVHAGIYRDWVERQLEGFVTHTRAGRPQVVCKLAQGVDGRLRAGDGPDAPRWLTGRAARTAVHRWRSVMDAVLVGSGTVLADDPRLDVRHVSVRGGQPRAVVLDGRLRTPPAARVARPGTLVLTAPGADPRRRADLEASGVEVREVPLAADGRLDLHAAMAVLAHSGITSVLAEPGATLATALVAAGLVDRLVLHVALEVGPGPLRYAIEVPDHAAWAVERLGGAGPDLVLELVPPTAVGPPGPGEEES